MKEYNFKTINKSYYETEHLNLFILIIKIIVIRIMFRIQNLCFTIVSPKYEVNEYGAVLEMDHEKDRFRRIYPDETEYVRDITTRERYKSYHGRYFYLKKSAIAFIEQVNENENTNTVTDTSSSK